MSKFIIWAAFAAISVATSVSHAGTAETDRRDGVVGYGEFQSVNADHNWVVIDDQAMFYRPGLKIRDVSDSLISDVSQIKPGTPVEFVYVIRNQAMHVLRIRLLDELPVIVDEEGVPDR
jgi:hypothetical protein